MEGLSRCNPKKRKRFVQPKKGKRAAARASSVNISQSNLGSSESDDERLNNKKQCVTSTPIKTNSSELISRPTPPDSAQRKLDREFSESKAKLRSGKSNQRPRRSPRKRSCVKGNSNPSQTKLDTKTKTEAEEQFSKQIQRRRPRLNLDSSGFKQDESLPSSDLSIELSLHEEPQPMNSFAEDEESEAEEEDESLPSFLMVNTKSRAITKGRFVWYKLRNFPFWPAMVKSVKQKVKKASIMVVDEKLIQQKKGFLVALKCLKPYECEEFNELICKAKEKYAVAIQWSIDLIQDYILRKGIGSFSGSFLEYYAHHISYPVRRKYQSNAERQTFANDVVMEGSLSAEELDDSVTEQQEEHIRRFKRLLPDRTHAAHNRANEKLVQFIVKQGMVDQHLEDIMCGKTPSKWLHLFLSSKRRRIVNIYLEDDEQLDQVYQHLSKLHTTTAEKDTCSEKVKCIDRVPFVLDVLLPEALIHAIAGVNKLSPTKAEEKYLNGRRVSNRERQEFDLRIELMK